MKNIKKIIFLISLILFISILFYKKNWMNVEKYTETDLNNQADKEELLSRDLVKDSQNEVKENQDDLLQQTNYLNTINSILNNKLNVTDNKISTALKNIESNEINFLTKPENSVNGSYNICNKGADGNTMCSSFPHVDGNTYIRPGVTNGDIGLGDAKNVYLSGDNSISLTSKNVVLSTKNKGATALCSDQNPGLCTYLPHPNGNAYIRPGKPDGGIIMDFSDNILMRTTNAVNIDTKKINVSTKDGAGIDLCNSGGACSHFPYADGNSYLRPGAYNKSVVIGEAENIFFKANRFCFSDKANTKTVCLTVNDLDAIKNRPSTVPTPIIPTAVPVNSQVIKTGIVVAREASSGHVSFGYTFKSVPIVVSNIDDALGVPSGYQQNNVSTTGFNWNASSRGTIYRTIRWVAVGN
jgi:hypothetical protein